MNDGRRDNPGRRHGDKRVLDQTWGIVEPGGSPVGRVLLTDVGLEMVQQGRLSIDPAVRGSDGALLYFTVSPRPARPTDGLRGSFRAYENNSGWSNQPEGDPAESPEQRQQREGRERDAAYRQWPMTKQEHDDAMRRDIPVRIEWETPHSQRAITFGGVDLPEIPGTPWYHDVDHGGGG